MTLFGHDLGPRPTFEGPATDAQLTALANVCQGFGHVDGQVAVAVLTEAVGSKSLDKADASRLIDWANTAPEKAWRAVAHKAAERLGQGTLI